MPAGDYERRYRERKNRMAKSTEDNLHDEIVEVRDSVKNLDTRLTTIQLEIPALIRKEVRDAFELHDKSIGEKQPILKPDSSYKLVIYFLCSVIGGVGLLLFQEIGNVRTENQTRTTTAESLIHNHAADKHPTSVQAEIKAQVASFAAHEKTSDEKFARLQHTIDSVDEWQVKYDMNNAREMGELVAVQKLLLAAMVSYMKIGGDTGRASAETRGRLEESIKNAEKAIDRIDTRHTREQP